MGESNLGKRIKSFFYAFQGFWFAFRTQPNFRVQLFVMLLVIGLGWYFHIEKTEWLVLLLSIGVVISAELFNTAIEQILDFISPEYNKKAGLMKDIAAGAVLFTSIMAAIVGLLIFVPRIVDLVKSW